ncbi:MAG: hypothetical protein WC699_14860 [Bacteroidales bacterium]|jgi:hypothetical protein
METPANLTESLLDRVEAFGKTTYELSKLKLLETTTVVATSVISRISVLLVISLFVLVLTVGIALLLGEVLGKSYYGFFIVAGFYLVVGILAHFFLRKWLKKPVSASIIKQALKL